MIFTAFTADMVEKKGRPPGKNGKKRKLLMFTVFTADMVDKNRVPLPPGKTVKKKNRVLPFLPRGCLGLTP